jgi:hypothetical protein
MSAHPTSLLFFFFVVVVVVVGLFVCFRFF